ncbi:MAG: tRNA (cytidine(34)-2'-O)-methyltransferase [Kangiellaceae bacterium]|jgi:tRNA (cytidine/uridine-2'-O-)-methyltransferase|nr:tRNA (cytidine(34)-2'-O)-methyltransferase [Kangiellaceae bacterium]
MFHIALHEPQIAPNTGNILRLISNNGCYLHLIEPMGFDLEERKLRRAGLDYSDLEKVTIHKNYSAFAQQVAGQTIYACETGGTHFYDQVSFKPGDVLLFGSEIKGLPASVMSSIDSEQHVRIPMLKDNRSLNLSNSVAIVSYEAWRQNGFAGGL